MQAPTERPAAASAPALRLTTLGGLRLTRGGAPDTSPASQRRRLALLAVVAACGARGVSRDKLLGLLWPEGEPEQARQALHQAVHALRRALGADELFVGTGSLQLNPGVVASDVAELDDAVARGQHERAVALYGGPFLDGFFLDGVPEFERWVDAERGRRAREHAAALEALAAAAVARGDHAAVVAWRQRQADADPLSARAAAALVEALVAAGDRAGALRAAQVHATLVRQELEVEPDPGVARWIERLRAGEAAVGPSRESRPATAPATAGRAGSAERRPGAEEGAGAVADALAHRYAVDGVVTEGAVTTTYAARDASSGRPVRLHVIRPHLAASSGSHFESVLARVAVLRGAHLVPMLDFGAERGVLFYVTPVADGPLLTERLARERPLPVDEAVRVARGVARALAEAHAYGVLHLDLRPKHVTLGARGVAVAGFGIVEALGASGGAGPSGTGVTIGAPAYLSPEQLTGEREPDARSDVYSAGVLLYEMLAGELPFGGDRYTSLSRKLGQAIPSPWCTRASVPEALEQLVRRCLERMPADRFVSAEELAGALDKCSRPDSLL